MKGHTEKKDGRKNITFLREVEHWRAAQIHANMIKRYARREIYAWAYREVVNTMAIQWQKPLFGG